MSGSQAAAAVLGGGCFWCVEAVFERVPGVIAATSGYAGGELADPSYEAVCTGTTGHAEVVKIDFDPGRVDFSGLLDVFWAAHDPTTPNQQGVDRGSQYRSIILAVDDGQVQQAQRSREAAQGRFSRPIVTEIVRLERFWPALDSHQGFYRNNSSNPYCQFNIVPKLKKLGLL